MRTIISRNCDESTNSIETEPHDQQKKLKISLPIAQAVNDHLLLLIRVRNVYLERATGKL